MRGKEGNGEKREKKRKKERKKNRILGSPYSRQEGGKKYGRVDEDYVTVTDRLY